MHNPIWFVLFSGWPAFLTVVGIVVVFMLGLSVVMTWLGNRSVAKSILYAVIFLTGLTFGTMALIAYLTN